MRFMFENCTEQLFKSLADRDLQKHSYLVDTVEIVILYQASHEK